MKLIEKNALIAEIDRLENKLYYEPENFKDVGAKMALDSLKSSLDTLEVKEVDLDESARHYLLHEHLSPLNDVFHQSDIKAEMQYHRDIENAYKKGFELGLKTQKGE